MNDPKSIYVLTDDPLLSALTRSTFTRMGNHNVLEECDARHALRAMWAFRPHLIVLDLDADWLGGDDLPKRLRGEAALSGLPMILLGDSRSGPGIMDRQERFLPKPIKPLDLLAAARVLVTSTSRPDFATATRLGREALNSRQPANIQQPEPQTRAA